MPREREARPFYHMPKLNEARSFDRASCLKPMGRRPRYGIGASTLIFGSNSYVVVTTAPSDVSM